MIKKEAFVIFAFTMAEIWILPRHWIFPVLVVSFIVFSWRYHGDTLKTVGLATGDFSQAKPIFIGLLISLLAIFGMALVLNPGFSERENFWEKVFIQAKGYVGWAFVQQLVLHGYFTNRLQKVFVKIWPTALAVGGMFAIAHLPNPVLSLFCLIFGTAGAYFFLKARNLYLLTLAHAILGTAIKYLLAKDLFNHGMRIGPGFWQ